MTDDTRDIVNRMVTMADLRRLEGDTIEANLCDEAADEIARLRAAQPSAPQGRCEGYAPRLFFMGDCPDAATREWSDGVTIELLAAIPAALGASPPAAPTEHRQGCEALGGYGHGIGPCTCGLDAQPAALAVPADAEDWLRDRFGIVQGHPEWRGLIETFNAGKAAAPGASPPAALAVPDATVESLAHRIAWRYKKSSNPHHSDTYTFNRATLLQFAQALASPQAPQTAPAQKEEP